MVTTTRTSMRVKAERRIMFVSSACIVAWWSVGGGSFRMESEARGGSAGQGVRG